MSSSEHIKATPGYEGLDWPHPMGLAENLVDLEQHAADFDNRVGFTYSILDGAEVIGCLYLYPSDASAHDVDVRSWVREDRATMDVVVWRAVTDWLSAEWPFDNPRYADRLE
jgi:hypothetical protein